MPPVVASRPSLAERYAAEFPLSRKLHEQARDVFPHGVTHDARHLEPYPIYVDRAAGARKWTVEGKELVDYWSGHGALLLGRSSASTRIPSTITTAAGSIRRVSGRRTCSRKSYCGISTVCPARKAAR